MSMNYDTIAALRREDEKMADALQFIVPVRHGGGAADGIGDLWAPSTYPDRGEPPVTEKTNYARMLTGVNAMPVINITEEDVQKMKDKAWKSTLWDFDNWVGGYLKPNENPANKALLAKVYPEWLERQKTVIENFHDFKKRVETLKIMGPKNKEDLFLFYRMGYPQTVASGQGTDVNIRGYADNMVPPGLTDAAHVQPAAQQAAAFQRGIFNWNSKENITRALYHHPRSVFPGHNSAPPTAYNSRYTNPWPAAPV